MARKRACKRINAREGLAPPDFYAMRNKKYFNPVMAAVFSSLLAVISQIVIPTPFGVPLTLQTFAVALCGYTLSKLWAVAAVAVWLSVGLIGLPVFSGFGAGAAALFGVSGGFLWGFLALAFFCGISAKQKKKSIKFAVSLAGLIICHLIGAVQFSIVSGVSFFAALLTSSLPYIIKDCILILIALSVQKKFFTKNVKI